MCSWKVDDIRARLAHKIFDVKFVAVRFVLSAELHP